RFALPFARGAVRAELQQAHLDVFGGQVERGRACRLQDARAAVRTSDDDPPGAYDHVTAISFDTRRTGIVPDGLLPGAGGDGERRPFLPDVAPAHSGIIPCHLAASRSGRVRGAALGPLEHLMRPSPPAL